MEYERDYSLSGMYFATEIRFDGIAKLARHITSMFDRSGRTAPRTATATA